MGDEFYKVVFVDDDSDYYFHNYEDASAFLLESFADDFYDLDNEQLGEANAQLAEEGASDDYGMIIECYFEK